MEKNHFGGGLGERERERERGGVEGETQMVTFKGSVSGQAGGRVALPVDLKGSGSTLTNPSCPRREGCSIFLVITDRVSLENS